MKSKLAKYGLLFVTPFMIVFLVFQLYPILYTLYLSFMRENDRRKLVFGGLRNFIYLAGDTVFWQSVANTWIIWTGCIIPQLALALILAVLLSQYKIRGANFFRAVFYLPNLVTAASIGVLFSVLLDWQTGTVNKMLLAAGLVQEPVYWMGSPNIARSLTSIIQWWMWFGHSTIILTAGVKAISPELIEASVVDGAGNGQRFFRITLPLLRPTLLYVAVTSLIGGMQIFDIPMSLTGGDGRPNRALMTMVLYVYNTAFRNKNYAYGAAVSYGIFIIILIVSLLFFRIIAPKASDET
ncbi:sugar ABC transporter ATP-binding protein [Spirochaetia bacterium]|nr:sugar ABC transporter ATP-binding protein [Spirochaetia bacterium]